MGTIKLLARLAIRQKGEKAITDRVLASARDEKASFYSFSDEDMHGVKAQCVVPYSI